MTRGASWFADEAAWKAYLAGHEVTSERHVRIATEGALLGSLIAHGVSPEMGVLSDGAGQFDVFVHALCWLHVERPLERLVPHNEKHRQAIERVRQRIWELYTGLKAYQQALSLTAREALAKQFDELVADRTDYPSIDGVLKGMAADQAKLLLVLQRPEVPLHNNLSEGHIRDYVKKRKISGSTRSDSGRRARDTFASLKKTCRRLGVNFWEYLQDRVRGLGKVPRLADLIRQKAEEAAARRAPAAPPPDPDGGAGGLNAGSGLRCLVFALRLRGTTRRIPCLVFLRSYGFLGVSSCRAFAIDGLYRGHGGRQDALQVAFGYRFRSLGTRRPSKATRSLLASACSLFTQAGSGRSLPLLSLHDHPQGPDGRGFDRPQAPDQDRSRLQGHGNRDRQGRVRRGCRRGRS